MHSLSNQPCRPKALSRTPKLQAMGLWGFGNMLNVFGKTKGCKIGSKEAPAGLKLATFAGNFKVLLKACICHQLPVRQ